MNPEIGISLRGKLILAVLVIVFIMFIFSLLKKRKISETLGLLWLFASVGVIIVISQKPVMLFVTHLLGAQYPASALAMLGILFLASLLLYFTLTVTSLSQQLRTLVQQFAIKNMELENKISSLEQKIKDVYEKSDRNPG